MKKKVVKSDKLSLDKEVIAKLNDEQLTNDQTELVEGGATITSPGVSCCGGETSCQVQTVGAHCPKTKE